jgi:hypothetical protein
MVAGSKFDLKIDTVAKNAPFLFVLSVSNQTWSGVSLPLDMANFGLPGCFLNVGYDKAFGLTSDGFAQSALPIQTTSAMAGLRLYAQIVVPESGGARIAASPGYELTIQKSLKPFNFVVIPDSQYYTLNGIWATTYAAQTQWIVDNRVAKNTVFVSHVGDVVENGATGTNKNKREWDRANAAMAKLDGDLTKNPQGVIPYATVVGAHDFDVTLAKGPATQYIKYFGPSRYTGRKWYGGSDTSGLNSYQIFESAGQKFLHLAMEWRPSDAAITWAQKVLTANAKLPAIIATHQYLIPGAAPTYSNGGATPSSGGDNGGDGVRQKLVEPFPQVFMVICGHHPDWGSRSTNTALGQTVVEMLFDYQFDPNGGNGWMNTLEFRPDKGEIRSTCFSPTYKPGVTLGVDRRTSTKNNYTLGFRFHRHRRMLEATRTVRFTGRHDHGNGIYTGALDTYASSAAATTSFGSSTDVVVNDPTGTAEQQGLIKFGGIFGAGAGQIPKTRRIARAILTLTTEGPGAKSNSVSKLYQLLVPFDEKSTWSSLSGGIQVGTETLTSSIADTGNLVVSEGTRSFDVTASVRAWQAGAKNHGWAILSTGTDSWSFRSQDWGTPAERPMLTVIFEL